MRQVLIAVRESLAHADYHPQFEKESEAAAYLLIVGLMAAAILIGFLALIGWVNGGEIY